MCQLVIPEATIGSVIPVTSEEQELDSSLDIGKQTHSIVFVSYAY